MVVVDSVVGLSDAHEVSMTPASVEKSEIAIASFFTVAFDAASLSAIVVAMIILSIIMTGLLVVPAMFPADVLAVNPMMPIVVARHPDHFIVARPIARAMVVERPGADLD